MEKLKSKRYKNVRDWTVHAWAYTEVWDPVIMVQILCGRRRWCEFGVDPSLWPRLLYDQRQRAFGYLPNQDPPWHNIVDQVVNAVNEVKGLLSQ